MANQGWGGQGGYPGGQQGGWPQQNYGGVPAQAQRPDLATSRCQGCHREAPTKHVTLMQNVGALIIRFPKTVRGALCKRCISSYFWRMTTITFFFGWWGIISFFYSLVSIPANIVTYIGSRSLPDSY